MSDTLIELAPNHKRGLTLRRPVMNAAGTLGFAGEARGLADLAGLGAFVTSPFTWAPRTPAAPPNAIALPPGADSSGGVLIHTGLPNPGVRRALARFGREWRRDFARLGVPVIVHLAATSVVDVARSLEWLEREDGVSGLELGLRDDVKLETMVSLIRAARGGPPLVVRLPVLRAAELCVAAVEAGVDALTVGAPARLTVEVEGRAITGRVYGPDQLPAALEAVRAVLAATTAAPVPVVGAGGVFSVDGARAMLEAGASAVQVDAALWQGPGILLDLAVLTPSEASSES